MKRVVLGAGPWGLAIMQEEAAKGHEVTLINRTGFLREVLPDNVSLVGLDIHNTKELTKILADVDIVFHCASAPKAEWANQLPGMMDSVIAAAAKSGSAVVYADNLYAYGDTLGRPISEITPEVAGFPLADVRKKTARSLIDAGFAGKVRWLIVRSPDLYGPRVLNSPLGSRVFLNLLAGQAAVMLGALDLPHSFSYVKDAAKNTSLAAESAEAFGKIWHISCAPPITQQQILDILRDMLSRNLTAKLIRGSGFNARFDPVAREFKEIMYQYEKPFVVNHSRFSATFGERCTAYNQGLWETLDWFRKSGLQATAQL